MADQTIVAHGTHNNEEYEDQLVWDVELEEPIDNKKDDITMELVKETGENRKTEEKEEQHAKQRKSKAYKKRQLYRENQRLAIYTRRLVNTPKQLAHVLSRHMKYGSAI
eukprot:3109077-Ditylum_brightwellii.AAC.1